MARSSSDVVGKSPLFASPTVERAPVNSFFLDSTYLFSYLEKIGFHRIVHEVGTRNQMFMETFRNLKSHVLINGWGNWQGGDSLKSFSGNQRKKLAHRRGEEKIQWKVDLLDSIGFPWCV